MSFISQTDWDNLPNDEKEKIRQYYYDCCDKLFGSKVVKTDCAIEDIQNKQWNELSPDMQESYKKIYQYDLTIPHINKCLVDNFGEHNLSAPVVKTWRDIEEYYTSLDCQLDHAVKGLSSYEQCPIEFILKCSATLKIQKLIELGYGGTLTDAEEKELKTKYAILPNKDRNDFDIIDYQYGGGCAVSFHTREQAAKFISYPENKKLLKQFYLM